MYVIITWLTYCFFGCIVGYLDKKIMLGVFNRFKERFLPRNPEEDPKKLILLFSVGTVLKFVNSSVEGVVLGVGEDEIYIETAEIVCYPVTRICEMFKDKSLKIVDYLNRPECIH